MTAASIAIMKGYGYKYSFLAVFLYSFGMGMIEKREQERLIEKKDRLNEKEFTDFLKKEGVPYITL